MRQPAYDREIAKAITVAQRNGLEIHVPRKGSPYYLKRQPRRSRLTGELRWPVSIKDGK